MGDLVSDETCTRTETRFRFRVPNPLNPKPCKHAVCLCPVTLVMGNLLGVVLLCGCFLSSSGSW